MGSRLLIGLWMVCLLPAASLAAAGADLRLLQAVKNQDKAAVRALLSKHADVNARQGDGATALAWAVHRDDSETADLLIQAGADVNLANDYGVTPLWLACSKANAAMVEKLLKAGADPNLALLSGETALMAAAEKGSLDAVKLLLDHGANVNAKEPQEGQTAIIWAAAEKHSDILKVLLEHGADVRARTNSGFTPLLFAAQQGDTESARLLVKAGADLNESSRASASAKEAGAAPASGSQKNKNAAGAQTGVTPLLIAAASGNAETSVFLLDNGADPIATDGRGLTPLHYAAPRRNMIEVVKSLLAHHANPNARLPKEASGVGVTEMSVKGATPIFLAAIAGNAAAIRLLASADADPRLGTEKSTTPLMVAAGVGFFENRRGGSEQTALETVKLLVELGSDVNASGERNWTALHGAAYTGSNQIIQFLVGKGAKMDVMDEFGQTPLSIAAAVVTPGVVNDAYKRARNYRRETAELLLKLGATPLAASGVKSVEGFLPENFSTVTITDAKN